MGLNDLHKKKCCQETEQATTTTTTTSPTQLQQLAPKTLIYSRQRRVGHRRGGSAKST